MSDMLSPRERQIAHDYAAGDGYRVIAERYGISPATVRTHLATIYRKMKVSSKVELYRALTGTGLQEPSPDEREALISELALGLEDALRRERAIAQVLRIISRARGDLEQVIAAVLDHALELCDAEFGILFECTRSGTFEATFTRGIPRPFADWLVRQGALRAGAGSGLGRMQASHAPVNIADVRAEAAYRGGDPLRLATADLGGARSFVAIPMIAGDVLIGAFTIYRQMVRPFDGRTLETVQIFADQSVIAIENARLVGREASARTARDPFAGDAG